MKRIKLYKDITTEEIKTFAEVKEYYEAEIDAEMPIDNETMLNIINHNLTQNGGDIELLSSSNNEILAWCCDYSESVEAERYMATEEVEVSIRDLYIGIAKNDEFLLDGTRDNLHEDNAEDVEMLNRLEALIQKAEIAKVLED